MPSSRAARLESVRLTRFKSFRNETLPLTDVTVLTGRNGSGKSNALDGIDVLARLTAGEDIGDALDGRRREGGPIRGGSRGCAPHGEVAFELGCTVSWGTERYEYDIKVTVDPELRVTAESLHGDCPAVSSGNRSWGRLFEAEAPGAEAANIRGHIHNGKQGVNPTREFRDTRAVLSQIPAHVSGGTEPERAVLRGAQVVSAALRGAFQLDPVPHLMRDYVPERDVNLRRTGENISASVARLRTSNEVFDKLNSLVRAVADHPVLGLSVTRSDLGDVMLTLRESQRPEGMTPAREMSDGLLRFLAVATTLLTADRGLDVDAGSVAAESDDIVGGVLVLIEELENGLHPSMARNLLDLVRETTDRTGARVVFTTHSPALLNVLTGEGNDDVVVCYRGTGEESFRSHLCKLTSLPGYAESLAQGEIGDLVSRGALVRPESLGRDATALLRLLGVD